MKSYVQILAAAAALSAPAVASAEVQADPDRVAALKCQLAGLCGDEAAVEEAREGETIDTEDRGIVTAAQARAASSRPSSARATSSRSTPARVSTSSGSRSTTRRARTTRTTPARPQVDRSAAVVSDQLKGSAQLFVTFGTGKSALTSTSQSEIKALVKANEDLKAQGITMRLRIEGHASRTGREERNIELSNERAEAVKEALIAGGFSPEQLEAQGFGSSKPIKGVDGIKPSHKANQRVIAVALK